MTNSSKIATGFIAGTLFGVAIGMLFAPKKGSQTRAMISDKAKEIAGSVSRKYVQTKDYLGMNKMHQDEVVV